MACDVVEDFPFMLSLSKHSEPFFSSLLEHCAGRNTHLARKLIDTILRSAYIEIP
jgi:hypothetical protein